MGIKLIKKTQENSDLYTVYLDGAVGAEGVSKEEASAIVASYNGEKDCWMEKSESKANEAAYTAIKNPGQAAFLLDCGTPEKAKELNDAFYEVAFVKNGWEPNKAVIGGELIQGWNVGQYFTACVDPCDKAVKWCEDWLRNSDGKAPGIQGNDAGLESKGNEDRRGTDRYGHPVRRFTPKDLKGAGADDDDDDAGSDGEKFGLAYLDTTSINAFSNDFSTIVRDSFLHDLAQLPVSKKSIEDLLRKHQLHRWGRPVAIRDFFPENGIAYLGTIGPDGLPYKTLALKWGPALKK